MFFLSGFNNEHVSSDNGVDCLPSPYSTTPEVPVSAPYMSQPLVASSLHHHILLEREIDASAHPFVAPSLAVLQCISSDIADIAAVVSPTPRRNKLTTLLFNQIRRVVDSCRALGCKAAVCGSTAMTTALASSDLNITIVNGTKESNVPADFLEIIQAALESNFRESGAIGRMCLVPSPKFPTLRLTVDLSKVATEGLMTPPLACPPACSPSAAEMQCELLAVNITINQCGALHHAAVVRKFVKAFPEFAPFIVLLKAMIRDNSLASNQMSSTMLTFSAMAFYRRLMWIQSHSSTSCGTSMSSGQLFLTYLHFFRQTGIFDPKIMLLDCMNQCGILKRFDKTELVNWHVFAPAAGPSSSCSGRDNVGTTCYLVHTYRDFLEFTAEHVSALCNRMMATGRSIACCDASFDATPESSLLLPPAEVPPHLIEVLLPNLHAFLVSGSVESNSA